VRIPSVELNASVAVVTPLPKGNIAKYFDRWALIEADTLPVYLGLTQNDPWRIAALLRIPIAKRTYDYKTINRIDDLVKFAIRQLELFGSITVKVK
jgi:hypothetical protein